MTQLNELDAKHLTPAEIEELESQGYGDVRRPMGHPIFVVTDEMLNDPDMRRFLGEIATGSNRVYDNPEAMAVIGVDDQTYSRLDEKYDLESLDGEPKFLIHKSEVSGLLAKLEQAAVPERVDVVTSTVTGVFEDGALVHEIETDVIQTFQRHATFRTMDDMDPSLVDAVVNTPVISSREEIAQRLIAGAYAQAAAMQMAGHDPETVKAKLAEHLDILEMEIAAIPLIVQAEADVARDQYNPRTGGVAEYAHVPGFGLPNDLKVVRIDHSAPDVGASAASFDPDSHEEARALLDDAGEGYPVVYAVDRGDIDPDAEPAPGF